LCSPLFPHSASAGTARRELRLRRALSRSTLVPRLAKQEPRAEYLLGSFRFDSTDTRWKVRTWSEKNTEILIGSDYSVGTDEDSQYDCLIKFADFNSDGYDDLAVRCLVITRQGKILEDTTTIYTVQHGKPHIVAVKDPQQLATIRDSVCANVKKTRLCPSK